MGHFSVFSRIDGEKDIVYLHDPQWGPNRSVTKNELLELWQPLGELSEITGHVAIYLTENRATAQNHQCRRCEKTVEIPKLLQFFENWSTMFCPECGAAGLR